MTHATTPAEPVDPKVDELARSLQHLLLQQGAKQLRAGDLCPRCTQRGNPRPGRLGPNMDHDLACHVCGHVVYRT